MAVIMKRTSPLLRSIQPKNDRNYGPNRLNLRDFCGNFRDSCRSFRDPPGFSVPVVRGTARAAAQPRAQGVAHTQFMCKADPWLSTSASGRTAGDCLRERTFIGAKTPHNGFSEISRSHAGVLLEQPCECCGALESNGKPDSRQRLIFPLHCVHGFLNAREVRPLFEADA